MIRDSTAIVTGGGRGIGQAICDELAERGADVAVLDLDVTGMEETVALVESAGRSALAVEADVSDPDDVADAVERVSEAFGSVEFLVNNAGVAGPTSACEAVDAEDWDATMAVNLRGPFLTCRALVPRMKDQGFGRIVNIASVTGKKPLLNRTPYAASKMGLIGFTRTLALEVGEHDINVNAVCPGSVDGPRIRSVFEEQAETSGRSAADVQADVESQSPRGELVQREDVADTVAYLCSDDASRITGQDVNVSAGKVMY